MMMRQWVGQVMDISHFHYGMFMMVMDFDHGSGVLMMVGSWMAYGKATKLFQNKIDYIRNGFKVYIIYIELVNFEKNYAD